ncbi:hypothetical protein [Cronobacter dublinensis]|uniref:hypothetical protein n=1 Tax=Cronobacter dublinensis TaxID=413497 RepID=UPI00131A33C2|nr:hypothetical protein [Cronobacter dublinensis]
MECQFYKNIQNQSHSYFGKRYRRIYLCGNGFLNKKGRRDGATVRHKCAMKPEIKKSDDEERGK